MLLECPKYDNIRRKYIKSFYWKPSTYTFLLLLSINNIKVFNQLGKYLSDCNKLGNIVQLMYKPLCILVYHMFILRKQFLFLLHYM